MKNYTVCVKKLFEDIVMLASVDHLILTLTDFNCEEIYTGKVLQWKIIKLTWSNDK